MNKESDEIRIVEYFDEGTGFVRYKVQRKDLIIDLDLARQNPIYAWRTTKSNMGGGDAERYAKNYREYLRDNPCG